jgi:hypothetical protein
MDAASAPPRARLSLAILEATFGEQHPRVAAAHHNLANAAMSRHEHARARASFARAVAIDLATMGADNPHRGASLYASAMAARTAVASGRAARTSAHT